MPHSGPRHPRWKGGITYDKQGRALVRVDGRKKYDYVLVAEAAFGGALPAGAVVHHADGNHRNNDRENLVICQDQKYHMLLHHRQRVLYAGGDPDTQTICGRCSSVKLLTDFYTQKAGRKAGSPTSYCKVCIKELDTLRTLNRRKYECA